MKKLLFITVVLISSSVFAQSNCTKCDIEKVAKIEANVNQLTYNLVLEFLCTFDSVCHNNSEYSEFSNKMLFAVLENAPDIYFKALKTENFDSKLFLKVVENPNNDLINLQKVYTKIKMSSASNDIKTHYLKSVRIAADKIGLEIRD